MLRPQVLVVGAGPTGLVLALQLARRGVPIRIVDKNAGPGEVSRAMAVHARTLEFYRQLGFGDEVVARGVKVEAVHLREGGEEVAMLPLGDLGAGLSPYPFILSFPQDDHERFLLGKLEEAGVTVEWNTALADFAQDAERVRAVLETSGGKHACEAAFLCGCDGAHSRVRHGLALDFPGGSYEQVFYVADVKIAGENRSALFLNLAARDLALMLPVRSNGMQRFIGTVPAVLSGRDRLAFADIQPLAERLLGVQVERVNWFSTYHSHHRVAARFRVGRAFLAGDAGHIHSPAGGQGMNTGIGDAVNLGWKLAAVLQRKADPAILDTYESERIAFARTLVRTTDALFRGAVDQSRGGEILRTWLLPHILPMLTGFSPVRRFLFRTLSQTRINYHGSALAEGEAGHVQGGDRLPWVRAGEDDNFAPLRSLDWQLHVYGEPSPAMRDTAGALALPVETLPWNEETKEAGLARNAGYLVRPDGYVALALPDQDAGQLGAFARRLGLRFAPPASRPEGLQYAS